MDAKRPYLLRRIYDVVLGLSFVSILVGLSVRTLVGPSTFDQVAENRRPAEAPAFERLADFPAAAERAFSDAFAFRSTLVRFANLLKVGLGVSPSEQVLLGAHGFLFYAGEDALTQFRRIRPFSQAEIAHWRDTLTARRNFLAERGIAYLVLIAPNKETVYADEIPKRVAREPRPPRIDQLLDVLRRRTDVTAPDLRRSLDAATKIRRTYFRTDSHWNDYGAFAAYGQVAESLRTWFPSFRVLSERDLGKVTVSVRGDLSGMLALSDDLTEPDNESLPVKSVRARDADPHMATAPSATPLAREVPDSTLPSAVVLHDSFMIALRPFLSEGFRRSVFLPNHTFPVAVIERERPDVVIEEFVERHLMRPPPPNPPELESPLPKPGTTGLGTDEVHGRGIALLSDDELSAHDISLGTGGAVQTTGPDPYVSMAVAPFDARDHGIIRVTMTAYADVAVPPGPRYGELFWAGPRQNFEQRRSLRFIVHRDGLTHTYRVPCQLSRGYRGAIVHLRLDFPVELGARYTVSAIQADESSR